jgi:hypothetical protein
MLVTRKDDNSSTQIGHDFTALPLQPNVEIPGIAPLLQAKLKVEKAQQWVDGRRVALLKRMEDDMHALEVVESVPLRG